MNAAQRRVEIRQFLETVDWDAYDYTQAPGADLSFPDFTEAQLASNPPWLPRHFTTTRGWNRVHLLDLNQIADGLERRMFALYGLPVSWPLKKANPYELDELLSELDRARETGGEAWENALDQHGLLNDEHYLWVRGHSLGFPEKLRDYESAEAAIMELQGAVARGNANELFSQYGFRDQLHFECFQKRVHQAQVKAWQQLNERAAILAGTFPGQLGAAAQRAAASMDSELGQRVRDAATLSFEDWRKIQAQLKAASTQGVDPNDVLAQYQLDAAQFQTLTTRYTQQLAAGKAGSDVEV